MGGNPRMHRQNMWRLQNKQIFTQPTRRFNPRPMHWANLKIRYIVIALNSERCLRMRHVKSLQLGLLKVASCWALVKYLYQCPTSRTSDARRALWYQNYPWDLIVSLSRATEHRWVLECFVSRLLTFSPWQSRMPAHDLKLIPCLTVQCDSPATSALISTLGII